MIITTIIESIDTVDSKNINRTDEHVKHVITNTVDAWFYDDKLHRLDGPALTSMTGLTFDFEIIEEQEWWYHGTKIECSSQEEFERLIKLKVFW